MLQPFLKAECGHLLLYRERETYKERDRERERRLRQKDGGPRFPRYSPVQEVAGELREEVGQVVVCGMGPCGEA